ncbi:type II toxin-antitoxin system RelE/ParE family toxin [Pararhizobium sp. O133]|uniref:type II toxin-antitoxin system RelE/ParE family toxin n=1 Tax=Pararhizobium sp. O133 TaxID=3449278 RepID=UPI003F68345E
MKVTLSPAARDYVRTEAAYLRSRSPQAAQHFADSLKRLKDMLARFPSAGHISGELPMPGVLRMVMGAYLVDYEIRGNAIRIFAVRHGRERPPGMPLDEDFDLEGP